MITPEQKRFAESFRSERELHVALHSLFCKMPDVSGVRIVHGPLEVGKDLIFYTQNGLEKKALFACVVKRQQIRGTAGTSTSSARNILIQAQQALDTAHVNGKGKKEFVAHVYVISPYDCERATMMSIEGFMEGGKKPITFLCGADLIDLFKKYFPEYFLDSSYLGDYLASLRQGVVQDSALTNLLHRHSIGTDGLKSLINVYVPQSLALTLHKHKLYPPRWPSLGMLTYPTHRSDITSLIRALLTIAQFAPQLQCWSPQGPFGNDLAIQASALSKLADEVMAQWKRAFDDSKVTTAQIKNPDVLVRKLGKSLAYVRRYYDFAEVHVNAANEFAEQNWTSPPQLGSQEYLNYCRIEEISDVAPSFISPLRTIRRFTYFDGAIGLNGGRILVTGAAGHGKTSFCRWNVLKDIGRLMKKKSRALPIYVQLHKLAQGPISSFEDIIGTNPAVMKMIRGTSSSKTPVKLYLDGLDEIPSVDRQREIIQVVEAGIERHPDWGIILTARDYAVGPWLSGWPRLRLSEFDNEQVKELTENWLGARSAKLFLDEVSELPGLQVLLRVPLLCTLVIALYRNPKLKRLPEDKIRLYELFINLLCGGWDYAKNISRQTQYGYSVKDKVLQRLAGHMHNCGTRDFGDADLRIAIEETHSAFMRERQELLSDILHDGLIVRTGVRYAFAHFSFQEYLAAKDLNEPNATRATAALLDFLSGNEWWREVLSFYIGYISDATAVEKWISDSAAKLKHQVSAFVLQEKSDFLKKCMSSYFTGHRFSY